MAADPPTAMVIVEDPEPGAAIEVGLKLTVTPLGWPVADNAIAELNPPETAVVIVDVPLEPRATESESGEALMEKPVVTVNLTVAVCVMPPPVPVTVIG